MAQELRPYHDMVRALFKVECTGPSRLMHAAIGIAGEVGEIHDSFIRDNFKEELGDLQFYLVAAWQVLADENEIVHAARGDYDNYKVEPLGLLLPQLTVAACNLLDSAKKAWVYNKKLDISSVVDQLELIDQRYKQLLHLFGFTESEIKEANQRKLGKRYPEGVYSDAAAQARADKSTFAVGAAPLPIPKHLHIDLDTVLADRARFRLKRRDRATADLQGWTGEVYRYIAHQALSEKEIHEHIYHERVEHHVCYFVTLSSDGLGEYFAIPTEDVVLIPDQK